MGDGLRGIALNCMVWDHPSVGRDPGTGVNLTHEAPWVAPSTVHSAWNPPARFGVHEIGDPATEDETLIDLWVDEGLPHRRVSGPWDRPTARAWLATWINATSDVSNFAMVPKNLSEWRKFILLAEKADAKVLWFSVGLRLDRQRQPWRRSRTASPTSSASARTLRRKGCGSPSTAGPARPRLLRQALAGAAGVGQRGALGAGSRGRQRQRRGHPRPRHHPPRHACWKGRVRPAASAGSSTSSSAASHRCPAATGPCISPVAPRKGSRRVRWCDATSGATRTSSLMPMPDLCEEVAVRCANFSNLVGFQDGSFDGAAWFSWCGRWAFYKFATLVHQNLDHPTAVHTSGIIVAPGWPECRFNAVRAAFGGPFTTQPAGVPLQLTAAGHPQPGPEEVANQLLKGLAANSRQFSIGHVLQSGGMRAGRQRRCCL